MTKIKKLGVLSVAKVEGLLGVIIGLIAGICFTLVGSYLAVWQAVTKVQAGAL